MEPPGSVQEEINLQILSSIVITLFYAVVISIPVFIVLSLVRGTRANTESAISQQDIRRLLEELLTEQKKTNDLLRGQKKQ